LIGAQLGNVPITIPHYRYEKNEPDYDKDRYNDKPYFCLQTHFIAPFVKISYHAAQHIARNNLQKSRLF
jgi:hypothetical protein